MYTAFYGLREKPFALSPDPRFLFLADSHREALAHLLYGLEQGEGFIVVTGEVGTGKTTICRSLLERLGAETEVAFLFNPSRTALELLQAIDDEFGLATEGLGRRELLSRLNSFLLEKKRESRRVVLIIDEAQNLSKTTLEQVRLLSNLETSSAKLIQIVLLGQPELDVKLDSPELRQLRQRIGVRWSLGPLSQSETIAYVKHRLRIAAGAEREIFSETALRELHRRSGGVPRVVNVLCDRALLAGYAAQAHHIGPKLVKKAARELPSSERRPAPTRFPALRPLLWGSAALVTIAASTLYGVYAGSQAAPAWLAPEKPPIEADRSELPPVASPRPPVGLESPAPEPQLLPPAEAAPLRAEETWVGLPVEPGAVVSASALADPAWRDAGDFLADLLGRQEPSTARWRALDALLAAHGLAGLEAAPASSEDAIAQLAARQLAVFRLEQTSLGALRDLDHPALLELRGADGVLRSVALLSFDGELAGLVGASEQDVLVVPASALEKQWQGSAYVIWRSFESLPEVVGAGEKGLPVLWLQSSLKRLGHLGTLPSGIFDEATADAVRSFQKTRNLTPDGVAGPLTQMSLYDALGTYAQPRLASEDAG
jgi:general secretion pathway protein A